MKSSAENYLHHKWQKAVSGKKSTKYIGMETIIFSSKRNSRPARQKLLRPSLGEKAECG